jgi:hypothetical protein
MNIILRAAACLFLFGFVARAGGLYAIFYNSHQSPEPQVLSLPYISGGQVDLQWADLQTGPATYNWKTLDSAMAAGNGPTHMVRVDGSRMPPYLLNLVPYTPNWGNVQVFDTNVLMYWHPAYQSALTSFIAALATHLKASPYRPQILSVPMHWDAMGTEPLVPPTTPLNYQLASTWTVPPGVKNAPDWSTEIEESYQFAVLDAYTSGFAAATGAIPILLQSETVSTSDIMNHQATGQPSGFTYAYYLQQGKWGLWEGGSVPEPNVAAVAQQMDPYLQYALPGPAVGFAESYQDAWGTRPVNYHPDWCPPTQFNYWRLLSDLNMGASFLGIYGADLTVAQSATHLGLNVGADFQAEFDQAFRFAARYARDPTDAAGSPGAWIAFRQSTKSLPGSDYNTRVTDYKRFVTLLNPQDTVGMDCRTAGTPAPVIANETDVGEYTIGPYTSRFGAWARKIPAGNTAELQLDAKFLAAVNSVSGTAVNIIYLDNIAGASFTTNFGTQSAVTKLSNSGAWQTVTIPVTSKFIADAKGGHIAITTADGAVIFHMVEVTKPAGAAGSGQGNRHRKRP